MLLLADPRRIRRIRSLGHSLHRLTATMPFRHLTLKRPFYNGFMGPVPTGSYKFCGTIADSSCSGLSHQYLEDSRSSSW